MKPDVDVVNRPDHEESDGVQDDEDEGLDHH